MITAIPSEVLRVAVSLILLGIGWLIGRQLTILWSRRQKQNEQELTAERQFHRLYGSFFATWKLWNYFLRTPETFPGASRWELLRRASEQEGELEATFVELASRRQLSRQEISHLGRFRQYYQQLRESIRDNKPLAWDGAEHPDYKQFKNLTLEVAAIIRGGKPISRDQLERITSNIHEAAIGKTRP